jgi:DNA invertase Pin-like site-specific DNA recombinase
VTTATPPGWAIYCRLSRRKTRRRNDRETVERQEALCRKYAAEHGLAVDELHVYVDNDRSAWKAADDGGSRPAWDAMITAGHRGEFAGILAYKLDRFSRNMPDAEALVTLGAARAVLVDGPGSGRINLTTAHGRRTLREAAVQATAESDNTSERVRDALHERARGGLLLGGGRLFGYEVLSQVRDDDGDLTPRQRPAEAAVIREAAARMLGGEPLAAIAIDLNERGLPTVRGGRWTGANLGRMLGAHRYGGKIILNREEVGTIGEPILDEATYQQVQAMLAARRRGRRQTGRWPLTGILACTCW